MKSLSVFAILVFLAMFGGTSSRAQDPLWQELELFSGWMEEARSFYAHTQSISMEIDTAETLIDDHVAGIVSAADMRAEVEATLRRAGVAIDEVSATLTGGLDRPEVDNPQMRRAADTFATYLESVDAELRAQYQTTQALLEAAVAGDWETYDLEISRSLRLSAQSLRSEGIVLSAMMHMQDPRGPTHALSRTITALYEPSAIQLELLAAYIDGQAVDFRAAYSLVEASIISAENAIDDGEAATQSMHRQADAARTDASTDPAVGEFLSRVASSFDRSFEIERRLLSTLSEFQLLMLEQFGAPVLLDDRTIARMSEVMVALEIGLAERFAEQDGRLSDLQNLAAAMQH